MYVHKAGRPSKKTLKNLLSPLRGMKNINLYVYTKAGPPQQKTLKNLLSPLRGMKNINMYVCTKGGATQEKTLKILLSPLRGMGNKKNKGGRGAPAIKPTNCSFK